jgi:hypothetical protein
MYIKSVIKFFFKSSMLNALRMFLSFFFIKYLTQRLDLNQFNLYQLFQAFLSFSISLTVLPLQADWSKLISSNEIQSLHIYIKIFIRIIFSIFIVFTINYLFFNSSQISNFSLNFFIFLFFLCLLNVLNELFYQYFIFKSRIFELFIYVILSSIFFGFVLFSNLIEDRFLLFIGSSPMVLYTIPLFLYFLIKPRHPNLEIEIERYKIGKNIISGDFFKFTGLPLILSISEHFFNIVSRENVITHFSLDYSSNWQASLLIGNSIFAAAITVCNSIIYKFLISRDSLIKYCDLLRSYFLIVLIIFCFFASILFFSWSFLNELFFSSKFQYIGSFAFTQILIIVLKINLALIGLISIIHKFYSILVMIIVESMLCSIWFKYFDFSIAPNSMIIISKSILFILVLIYFKNSTYVKEIFTNSNN